MDLKNKKMRDYDYDYDYYRIFLRSITITIIAKTGNPQSNDYASLNSALYDRLWEEKKKAQEWLNT